MKTRLVWLFLVILGLACQSKSDADTRPLPIPPPEAPSAQAPAPTPAATATPTATVAATATAEPEKETEPAPSASGATTESDANAITPEVANELGRLNVSTSTEGLKQLGDVKHQLLTIAGRLANSPRTLSAVMNHDLVVDTFMERPDIVKACRDPEALRPILAWALKHPTAQAIVTNKESVDVVANSKLTKVFVKCPAFKQLTGARSPFLAKAAEDDAAIHRVVQHKNFKAALEKLGIKARVVKKK